MPESPLLLLESMQRDVSLKGSVEQEFSVFSSLKQEAAARTFSVTRVLGLLVEQS